MKHLTRRSFLGLLGKTAVVAAGVSLIGPQAVAAIKPKRIVHSVTVGAPVLCEPEGVIEMAPAPDGYFQSPSHNIMLGDVITVTGSSGCDGLWTVINNNGAVVNYV